MGRSGGADRLQQRPRAAGARRMPTVLYRSQRSVPIDDDEPCQIIDLDSNAPRLFLIRRNSRVVQFRGHVDALPDLPRLRRLHQEERRILRCVGEHVHGGRRRRPQRQLRRPNAVLRRGLLPGDGHGHLLQRRLHRRSRRQHCAA